MLKKVVIALGFAAVLLIGGCSGTGARPIPTLPPDYFKDTRRPVIVDTDMAMDDWLAVLYLLNRPDVEVKAILVVGTGEVHCEPGIRNALKLAQLAGQPETPVACGRETPYEGGHEFPLAWRESSDKLQGITIPDTDFPPSDMTAPELLASLAAAQPNEITLVTLGPLTNIAEAFEADPSLAQKFNGIYVMGGAVDAPGNVANSDPQFENFENTTAEWNFYADPKSAEIVFESGAPITMVGLDATNHVPATIEFFGELERRRTSRVAQFAYQVLVSNIEFIRSGGYFFWDPLTAVIATEPDVASFDQRTLDVVAEEGSESGRTRASEEGNVISVAVNPDKVRFETLFLNVLNR